MNFFPLCCLAVLQSLRADTCGGFVKQSRKGWWLSFWNYRALPKSASAWWKVQHGVESISILLLDAVGWHLKGREWQHDPRFSGFQQRAIVLIDWPLLASIKWSEPCSPTVMWSHWGSLVIWDVSPAVFSLISLTQERWMDFVRVASIFVLNLHLVSGATE